ncbi:MAG: hypothetical protein AAB865_01160 [Patescibacteria group bacterium]
MDDDSLTVIQVGTCFHGTADDGTGYNLEVLAIIMIDGQYYLVMEPRVAGSLLLETEEGFLIFHSDPESGRAVPIEEDTPIWRQVEHSFVVEQVLLSIREGEEPTFTLQDEEDGVYIMRWPDGDEVFARLIVCVAYSPTTDYAMFVLVDDEGDPLVENHGVFFIECWKDGEGIELGRPLADAELTTELIARVGEIIAETGAVGDLS